MQYLALITQFLKKHYEKIILCAVLLGLAAAATVMGAKITAVKEEVGGGIPPVAGHGKPMPTLDLSNDIAALSIVTNPPSVVLSGEHNLFNPVTWRRTYNGILLKILKTGPDALTISNITPLYTIISFEHPAAGSAGIYVMGVVQHSGTKHNEYAKVGEKTKSGLYIISGTKGAQDSPDFELTLKMLDTDQTVIVTKAMPYKQVDGYTADLRYDPESHTMYKQKVDDEIMLDNEAYKVVEITNNLIRVQDIKNTKETTIKWNESQ